MLIPAHERRVMRHDSETLMHTPSSKSPFDMFQKAAVSHPSDSYSENELEAMSHSELADLSDFSVTTIRIRREKKGLCARDSVVRATLTSSSHYRALAQDNDITYHKLMAARRKYPDVALTDIVERLKMGKK